MQNLLPLSLRWRTYYSKCNCFRYKSKIEQQIVEKEIVPNEEDLDEKVKEVDDHRKGISTHLNV